VPSPGSEARVARAKKSLSRLRALASTPWEEYSVNEDAQTIAERHLHILLVSILDLVGFIAVRRGLSAGPLTGRTWSIWFQPELYRRI
jgi:hypothetical protein